MKKLNLILSIIILALLSSCGSSNQGNENKQNANSSELENGLATDASVSDNYMTFKSSENGEVCIEVKYPKGETVWIDLNNNKQLDEGEKLDSVDYLFWPEDVYTDGYSVEKNITLKNPDFTIYGAVTGLYCPESGIKEIDISNNPYLENLLCHDNNLTNLDISKNKKLKLLFCVNNELTDLDISKNPNLEYLVVPRSIKSKVFNFKPEDKECKQILSKQNLIPKGYHILGLAENRKPEKNKDKLVLFEEDVPYANRKDDNNTQLIYFKNIGNDKYQIIGRADNLFHYIQDVMFNNEHHIINRIWESMEEFTDVFYKIEDGKIVRTKALAMNSVKPNAEGIYEVKTADELLGSIASDRTIKIMSKEIDLSKTAFGFVKNCSNDCNFEISGITFYDIENLKIIGGLDERTELLLNDMENTVLIFKDAENVKLQNLRIGHTPQNQGCYGGVLAFVACKKVTLDNLLLYGCGTEGITTCGMDQLNCKNLIIEHCTYNALNLNNCKNSVFENFEFKDNELYGSVIEIANSQNITFNKGKINNNDSRNSFVINTNNKSKSITFENVEIKDNKSTETTNNTDENVVKFIK